MKVGDYVRTEDGHIDKIVKISDEMKSGRTIKVQIGEEDIIGGYKDFVDWFNPSHFIKSSPNKIDLIEKKDIIKYHFNGSDYISEVFEYKNDLWVQNENNMFEISEINIKSIVTKEQFESMEYKVGE